MHEAILVHTGKDIASYIYYKLDYLPKLSLGSYPRIASDNLGS